jgi:hypothetical protein
MITRSKLYHPIYQKGKLKIIFLLSESIHRSFPTRLNCDAAGKKVTTHAVGGQRSIIASIPKSEVRVTSLTAAQAHPNIALIK